MSNSGFKRGHVFSKIYITDDFLIKKAASSRLGVKAFNDISYRDFQANDIYCAELLTNIVRGDVFFKLALGLCSPFGDGDTTPTVAAVGLAETGNTAPTLITMFDDPNMGQELTIIFGDNNTTIQHGVNIFLSGGANKNFALGQSLKVIYAQVGGVPNWYQIGGEI